MAGSLPRVRRRTQVLLIALAAGAIAPAAAAQEPVATAPEPVTPAPVVPRVPPPASHPALATGWARVLDPGAAIHGAPAESAPVAGVVGSTHIAGRAWAVTRDEDGAVWVRVAFPDSLSGWARGDALARAVPPMELSRRARRTLTRATSSLGRRSALVVRDPLGRTLFATGTRAPLSLASVTKLATVSTALGREALPLRRAAAILGPSDNRRAQLLSNRVGDGRSALGARRAVDYAATLGADWRLVDGSGLSPANRASAGEVADLLLGVRDAPLFRTLLRAMPVAGRTGTLEDRMNGTAAAGRMRGKTGSLFDTPASALAGYLWPAGAGMRPDRALIVVMLVNRVSPYRARPVQDAIAATLAAPGALTAAR